MARLNENVRIPNAHENAVGKVAQKDTDNKNQRQNRCLQQRQTNLSFEKALVFILHSLFNLNIDASNAYTLAENARFAKTILGRDGNHHFYFYFSSYNYHFESLGNPFYCLYGRKTN